ncbi:MAG: hypothetical protein WED10_11560 [Brumimicrobium sp.]
MKLSNQIFLLACTLVSTFSYSQVPKLKITEVYLTGGFSNNEISNASHADFQLLAPNSNILEQNAETFDNASSYYSPYRTNGGFSLQTGIQFVDKESGNLKKNPTLRLGLRYGNVNQLNGWSTTEELSAYDTLVSQNTGELHYLDSINRRTVTGNYSSEQISLDASLIFRTNQDLRWSVYGGLGLSVGFTINATTNIEYREKNDTEIRGYSSDYYYIEDENIITENYRNKSSIIGSLYAPIGVDFRLGKNSPFWNMFHLFAEAQPSINFYNIPELNRTESYTTLFFNTGIRVRW